MNSYWSQGADSILCLARCAFFPNRGSHFVLAQEDNPPLDQEDRGVDQEEYSRLDREKILPPAHGEGCLLDQEGDTLRDQKEEDLHLDQEECLHLVIPRYATGYMLLLLPLLQPLGVL